MVSFSKMAVQPFVIASVLFTSALGAPFHGKVIGRDATLAASYDFIVVGGGPSGLVVANRLSESSNVTVLVIEAGELDQREAAIQIPGNVAYGTGVVGTKYDWNLTYTAQSNADDREISIPLGKVVGGGTVLNRMLFDRGSAADYDRWATLGNDGWDWAGLLPYFIKSETWTPPSADLVAEFGITSNSSVHGTDGYLQSSYPPFSWPSTSNFFESVNSLGINVPTDGASGEALGAFWTPLALDPTTVTRCSARDGYYDTVSSRSNLHLLTGNQVTKLITNITACGNIEILGVQYATDSSAAIQNVTANTEVILAAGSIHTPQLLQLSGIGDSGLLSELGISTLIDLPGVGSNFQDHAYAAVPHSLNIAEYSGNITSNATYAAEMLALYETNQTGPYTTAGTSSLMFMPFANISNTSSTLSSTVASESASTYLPTNISATVLAGYEAQYKLLTDGLTATDIAVMEFIYNDGTIVPALQHPFSRGTVKINSTSAFDAPVADPRYLSNPNDLAIMVAAIKFARTIVATDAFAPLSPVELAPGAAVTSDADLESYVRSSFTTIYHPSGTAAMLPLANGGVVDSALLVYGTSNLRIVDASVFPMLPATHIMSTVYAVAEKAADAIKSANGL